MGGAFCRDARTDAVEGQQIAYVNLWDPLAHGHWPGADGRFGGGEADADDSRNGGVDKGQLGGVGEWPVRAV